MGERDPKYIGQRKKIILPSAIVFPDGRSILEVAEIQAYLTAHPSKIETLEEVVTLATPEQVNDEIRRALERTLKDIDELRKQLNGPWHYEKSLVDRIDLEIPVKYNIPPLVRPHNNR